MLKTYIRYHRSAHQKRATKVTTRYRVGVPRLRWEKIITYDQGGNIGKIHHFCEHGRANLFGVFAIERLCLLSLISRSVLWPFYRVRGYLSEYVRSHLPEAAKSA